MKLKKTMSRITRAAGGYGGFSLALIALVIAITFALNMIVYGLAERFSWYAYTVPKYEHRIGSATEPYFEALGTQGKTVRIRFCRPADQLKADVVSNLVYQSALQFEKKYDFIEVDHINIYTDPAEANQYRGLSVDPDTGAETEEHAISTDTVIIDNGASPTDFMVLRMSSFFLLDQSAVPLAYNGEEVMAAMIHRVLTREEKTVYFTTNHGESSSAIFYNLLVCAGYNVNELDLRANDVPEDAEIIVISNPIYDFEKSQAGSGVVSEIDRLRGFLAGGGVLYVMLDSLAGELTHLEGVLREWGLVREDATVRDVSGSLTADGLTLLADFGSGSAAARIARRVTASTDARVVLRSVAPIRLDAANGAGASVEAILRSGSGASAYADGKEISSGGSYPLAALARREGGGAVFLVSSIYMTAQDAISTNRYANADLLYALFEEVSGADVPLGCTVLDFETERLEGLTMGRIYFLSVLLVAVVPLAVLSVGTVVCTRRRNR